MRAAAVFALLAVTVLPGFRAAFAACPDSRALQQFRERIAFERTWADPSFKRMGLIHVNVWSMDQATGFYIQNPLGPDYNPRMWETYVFVGNDGLQGGGNCDKTGNWPGCLSEFAGTHDAPVTTCQITIDLRSIPAWRPSPNNELKRQAAMQMRREIDARYPDATEIVVRDFNLLDSDITFYARTPDHDYYQGFSFHPDRQPHCEGWHLFGMSPLSGIRKWILARPYRLK